MDNTNKTILVFVNDGNQYKAFLEYKKDNNIKYIICPLTPLAIHYCENNQIDFCIPSEFYQLEDYYKFKNKSENSVKDIIAKLNKYYSVDAKKKIDFELEMGSYFSHLLYFLIGSLHFSYFVLNQTIEKIKPYSIIVFKARNAKDYFDDFIEVPIENINYVLLNNSKYNKLIIMVEYDIEVMNIDYLTALNSKIRNILYNTQFLFNLFKKIRFYKQLSVISAFRKCNKKKVISLGGISRNWQHVMRSTKYSMFIYCYPPKELPKYNQTIESGSIDWEGYFKGLELKSVINNLFQIVEKTYSNMLKTYNKSLRLVKKSDVVVYSVLTSPWLQFIAHLAQSNNIKTIAYQHGEKGIYNQNCLFPFFNELTFADYYFSFGEGVSREYSKYIGKTRWFKYPISIGSTSLDKLNSVKDTRGKYILYASCKYFFNYLPFMNYVGPYNGVDVASDFKLYNAQKVISRYLNKLGNRKGTQVIWKLDPHPIRGKVPFDVEHIQKISTESNFQELLNSASLVILDSPTTTCLEACTTTKPLFLYLPNSMNLEAQEAIEKRAVIGRTPEELVGKIDEYIKSGKYPADVNNREYLRKLGTYLDDGRSVNRAKDFLLKI